MLDIDLTTILFQIINFLVLVVILYFLLFKKIIKRADLRKKELEEIERKTIDNYTESERLQGELTESINNLNEKFEKSVSEAKAELEILRLQFINEIRNEAEQIYNRTFKDFKLAQMKSLEGVQEKILNSSMIISRHLLANASTIEVHENLVRQINKRIWEMGKKEMRKVETIRRSLPEREPTLSINTAKPLGQDLQVEVIKTFSALADKNIKLDIKIDESLISGVQIRLGDYVFDNSLGSRMDEIKDSAIEELQNQLKSYLPK